MRITVHRGTKEIGGSCIEVATNHTRIILDVGLPLVDDKREPFDGSSLRDRSLDQLISVGTIAPVPGLFDNSDPPNAILLSHCHQDHSGLLHLTRPEIPIYTSKGTSKLMLASALFSSHRGLDRIRFRELVARQRFQIGDIRVTPFRVDHSAFDSMAFLIEADGKRVLYSGDLRLHGRKPGMAEDLLRGIANHDVDALLMEGTHFGSQEKSTGTERELEDDLTSHIVAASGLVLAAFSPLDVDRLVSFFHAARRSGRIFVLDAYAALVLHLIASQAKVPRPTADKGIRVLFNQAFQRRGLDKIARLFLADRIELDELLARPRDFVMTFRTSMAWLDFRGKLPAGSRCLYSYWKGYLANPDWIEMRRHLGEVGGDLIPAHVSGHIYVADIVRFVKAVGPKTVIPIHTFEPRAFCEHFRNVSVLEDGRAFEVA